MSDSSIQQDKNSPLLELKQIIDDIIPECGEIDCDVCRERHLRLAKALEARDKEIERKARLEVIGWLEGDLKRLDARNWTAKTMALDFHVGSGKADDYQKMKHDEIVTDRRAAHALYAVLSNYKKSVEELSS